VKWEQMDYTDAGGTRRSIGAFLEKGSMETFLNLGNSRE